MIKKSLSLFTFFLIGMALMSCTEQGSPLPTIAFTEIIKASATPQPTNTIQPSLTPTLTATPTPSYGVIQEKTVNNLEKIYQWDVDKLTFFTGTSFWFSDSNQFVLPIQKESVIGIQSFDVDKLAESWFAYIDYPSSAIVDQDDEIISYLHGLHIFNRQGQEIRTISTQDNCGKSLADYIAVIPNSNFIITGHQDAYSDTGLNYNVDDKASLIRWSKDNNTCSNLLPEIKGRLFALSASPDGRYIGYSFGVRAETGNWKKYTRIYDLDAKRNTCQIDGFISLFSLQNQLAVYNVDNDIISFVTPSDCKQQIKFNVNIKLSALSFIPNSNLLAGVSETTLDIWNVESGEIVKEIDLRAFQMNSPIIGFSPDGRFLVLAENQKVVLWGIREK
jgi:WD40 repeat protein